MVALEERLPQLKSKLESLRYHQPLGAESAPLVDALVTDLLSSHQLIGELREQADAQAHELMGTQNQVHPLRRENGRLLRENNQLHMELMKQAEEAEARLKDVSSAASRVEKQNTDVRFVNTQQAARIKELEAQLEAMRERFDQALQQNGVVLPSGHEVRWHGRKEHMQAHSPVAPAEPSGSASPAGVTGVTSAPAEAVALVKASETQITRLQQRIQALEAEAAAAKAAAAEAQGRIGARDEEIKRLAEQLEGPARDFEGLSLKHVNQSNQEAIAHLNHQVDFLNSQCKALEAELEAQRGASALAEQRGREKESLLGSVHELQADRAELRGELDAAQKSLEELQARYMLRALGPGDNSRIGATHASAGAASRAKRAENEANEARKQLAEAKAELKRARAAEASASAHMAASHEMRKAFESEKRVLGQASELLEKERRKMEERAEQAEHRAARLESEWKASRERQAELEQSASEARRSSLASTESLAALEADKSALSAKAEGLQRELEAARRALQQGLAAHEARRHQEALETKEKEELLAKLSALEATRAEMRHELSGGQQTAEQLNELVRATESEREGLQRECERLTQLLAAERASGAKVRAEAEALRARLSQEEKAGGSLQEAVHDTRSELLQAQLASRRAESDSALLRRQLLELELCRSQLAEAQAELHSERGEKRQAVAAAQAEALAREKLKDGLKLREAELDELQASVRSLSAERDALLSAKAGLLQQLDRHETLKEDLRGAQEGASVKLGLLEAELASVRETNRALQRDAESSAAAQRRAELAAESATQAQQHAREEGTQLEERAKSLAGQYERARAALAERGEALSAAEEAKRVAAAERDGLAAELSKCRELLHASQLQLTALQQAEEGQRSAADERDEELSQLKALVSRLDAGRAEMAERLKDSLNQLEDACGERRRSAASVTELEGALAEREASLAELRQMLGSLDRERDTLASEVDERAERLAALSLQLEQANQASAAQEGQLALAHEQAEQRALLLREAEHKAESLEGRLRALEQKEAALRGEAVAQEAELAATADDLRKMICENQILNQELQASGSKGDKLGSEAQQAASRAAYFEQCAKAKEQEKDEVLDSYRRLGEEAAALRSSLQQAALERDKLRAQLSACESELGNAQSHSARLEAEQGQLLLDLQAFERQNEQLTQTVAALDSAVHMEGAERKVAFNELQSLKQMLGGVERSREVVQREAAAAAQEKTLVQMQLEEAGRERENYKQQLELERARTAQLESLTVSLRAEAGRAASECAQGASVAATGNEERGALSQKLHAQEAELRVLRRSREESAAEIDSLRRAVGTASWERDTAAEQVAQAQRESDSRRRNDETLQRQSDVISELDAERLKLRAELEQTKASLGAMGEERGAISQQLEQLRREHAAQAAQLAQRAELVAAAQAARDEALLQLETLRGSLEQAHSGTEALAERGEANAAQARGAIRELSEARMAAAEAAEARDVAQRTVEGLRGEISAFQAALSQSEERYGSLLKQNELLIDAEHSLRLRLDRLQRDGADSSVTHARAPATPSTSAASAAATFASAPPAERRAPLVSAAKPPSPDGAALARQVAALEAQSSARCGQLAAADQACASLGAELRSARTELDAMLQGGAEPRLGAAPP